MNIFEFQIKILLIQIMIFGTRNTTIFNFISVKTKYLKAMNINTLVLFIRQLNITLNMLRKHSIFYTKEKIIYIYVYRLTYNCSCSTKRFYQFCYMAVRFGVSKIQTLSKLFITSLWETLRSLERAYSCICFTMN